MAELDQQQLDQLAEALAQKLMNERRARWVDPETHYEHHRFIKHLKDDEARRAELLDYMERIKNQDTERQERVSRIKERVVGSIVLAAVLGAVGSIGAWVMPYLRALAQLLKDGGT